MKDWWGLLRTPRKSVLDWIDSRISAEASERFGAFSRQLEVRSRLATLESVNQAQRTAAHMIEVHMRAMAAKFEERTAHRIESRAEISTMQAKAYADAGIYNLSRAIAAASASMAQSSKRINANEIAFKQMLDRFNIISSQQETLAQEFNSLCERVSILNDYNESLANADITPGSLSDAKDRLNGLSESLSAAVFDYNTQLRNSERRIEFIRSEVLFELQAAMVKASIRKAAGEGAVSERTVRNPKIINSQKVAEYREKGLRLNVGCGHIQPDGYLNVDAREIPGIDVIAEATNIPFNEGEVTEIFSSHLIEHFTENILKNVVLPHWHTLLKSGGTLTTVAPDGAEMLNAISKRDMSFADFREVLFGSQDYGGDFHYNLITPDSFRNYLEDAGFVDVIVDYLGRRNGKCFEFKIAARKL